MATTPLTQNGHNLPQNSVANYQKELAHLEKELNAVFLERSELIKLMLTSIVAKTNGFLGGPPGTGKTSLVKAVTSAFGGFTFYCLFGATTTPDEIIGSIDLVALQNGVFQRDLDRKLVLSDTAIADEIWKSNTPTLNSMLGIILDKEYVNGKQVVQSSLTSLWGCSNELPTDESLNALWDRLALRYWVTNVSRPAKKVLMMRQAGLSSTPAITVQFSLADMKAMQALAIQTPIEEVVLDCILDITGMLEKESGLIASTRKHNQIVNLMRCYAYVSGDSEVNEDHLDILEDILWNKPEERALIKKAIKQFGNPIAAQAQSILEAAQQIFTTISPLSLNMNRGQWMRDIGSADMQLTEIEAKLDEMIAQAKQKRAKKVKQVKEQVSTWRCELNTMIQQAYSLPTK